MRTAFVHTKHFSSLPEPLAGLILLAIILAILVPFGLSLVQRLPLSSYLAPSTGQSVISDDGCSSKQGGTPLIFLRHKRLVRN